MNEYIVDALETHKLYRRYNYIIKADSEEEAIDSALAGEFERAEMIEEYPDDDFPENVELKSIELLCDVGQGKN